MPDDEGCAHLARLVADELGADRVVVCDDGISSHAGAFAGGWGVALSVGTGVACATRGPADAVPDLLGGHGYLLGDEGGAYWIGRAGIAAALRAADGRGPSTLLVSAAESRFGAVRSVPILSTPERAVDEIAHFAPEVLAAAHAGDPVATAVVDDAVDELALVARAARRHAGSHAATPLVILGRLGAELIAGSSSDSLGDDPGLFDARAPLGDALDGAMLLAHSPADDGIHVWTRG